MVGSPGVRGGGGPAPLLSVARRAVVVVVVPGRVRLPVGCRPGRVVRSGGRARLPGMVLLMPGVMCAVAVAAVVRRVRRVLSRRAAGLGGAVAVRLHLAAASPLAVPVPGVGSAGVAASPPV
ncbi:hypothetical protein KGQ20_39780, partial [Catenulispora sp. NF23]|uniref:hypothetical protein n=1 Tax=Catenulispora pinistramenti TaxID=2705254 RepID=UPI001BAD6099